MTPDWRARAVSGEATAIKRASSRVNGTKFGRPRKVDGAAHIATAKRMIADGHTARDIAKYLLLLDVPHRAAQSAAAAPSRTR